MISFKNIEKRLEEWRNQGFIPLELESRILEYEKGKKNAANNTVFILFGIIGSILIGLGISLMVAENWDHISRPIKTILAFMPVAIALCLVLFTLLKRFENDAWRESTAAFWALAPGASISLIAQIYQIQGGTDGFVLLWVAMAAPVMFVLRSNAAWTLIWLGTTWYGVLQYARHDIGHSMHHYWWMLALVLVFVWRFVLVKNASTLFAKVAGYLLPMLFIPVLGIFGLEAGVWTFLLYFVLFQLYIHFCSIDLADFPDGWKTGFLNLGFSGAIVLLFVFSYKFSMKNLANEFTLQHLDKSKFAVFEIVLFNLIYLAASIKLFVNQKWNFTHILYPIWLICILVGKFDPEVGQLLDNVFILVLGCIMIWRGVEHLNFLWLNAGMVFIVLLIILRFFDFNLSFFIRGVVFILLGVGFFIGNKIVMEQKNRKELHD